MKAGAKAIDKLPVADRFRIDIEKAQASGTDLSTLVLKLTLRDGAKLKRDPGVPSADIRFANGEMRYLGVRVMEGDTAESALVTLQAG